MPRRSPTSVRFDDSVVERLHAKASATPGISVSGLANRLVDEGLRMADHPGITFRDGPMGRRAGLVRGPDVWEIIKRLREIRAADSRLDEADIVAATAESAGLENPDVARAIGYWAAYPAEVDEQIAAAERAEREALQSWERRRSLLSAS